MHASMGYFDIRCMNTLMTVITQNSTRLRKKLIFFAATLYTILTSLTMPLHASEADLIHLAGVHLEHGEYYNAITEIMRYQFLYPGGEFIPRSMLLMSEAYYRGGYPFKAHEILDNCHRTYQDRAEGEEALYRMSLIRMSEGSPFFAHRIQQKYLYLYPQGEFRETISADQCYSLALMGEFEQAKKGIDEYRRLYPGGSAADNLNELAAMIHREEERPQKNIWVSLIGSIFLPGFGHFYTERYALGAFTLGTNAALIYLIYDGIRDGDQFRVLFFSVLEFSFYQYSLFSSIRNVRDYNSREVFCREIQLGLKRRF
jgi:outer membrane protein assembly factor BamD (BamD/ComL family)